MEEIFKTIKNRLGEQENLCDMAYTSQIYMKVNSNNFKTVSTIINNPLAANLDKHMRNLRHNKLRPLTTIIFRRKSTTKTTQPQGSSNEREANVYNTKHEGNINIEWYNLQNPKMHETTPRIDFSFFDGIKTQLDLQK